MKTVAENVQYNRTKILLLWASVALPMLTLRFWVLPMLMKVTDFPPGLIFWCLMIIGMMWQFALSMIILKKELGKLTWNKLKKRLWLNLPIHPKTGKVFKRAYWLCIPIIIYAVVVGQFGYLNFIEEGISKLMPFLSEPDYLNMRNLMVPEYQDAWYIFGIAVVSSIFNYVLGEELFFRGILLPKMEGAFGKWDWIVNGLLFGIYHLHKITYIPVIIISTIFYAFLNKRYRSFYPAIIIHGAEAIPLFTFILLFLLGVM